MAKAKAKAEEHDALGWVMALLVLGVIGAFLLAMTTINKWMPRSTALPMSTVKISFERGHGSGVHIGDGLILTAAHVVKDQKTMAVHSADGKSVPGTTLWVSAEYDVALVKLDKPLKIASSLLSCASPQIGSAVSAIGNPGDDEFVTMRGNVGAPAKERGDFASAMILDMTVAPGMSGGPVLDTEGNIVGLVNAMMSLQISAFSISLLPISYAVPGKAICMLLGKVA